MSHDIVARLRQTHQAGCSCFGCEAAEQIQTLRAEINRLQDEQRVLVREINRVCQQDAVITDLRMLLEAQDQEIASLYRKMEQNT